MIKLNKNQPAQQIQISNRRTKTIQMAYSLLIFCSVSVSY
ncbi:hypothetical protein PROVRETT_05448 [Providencia rettgeri DSM 1131]|nr:hypothetical protein PROVRETT_05448 [Providencia rettgeri DSM 1131]